MKQAATIRDSESLVKEERRGKPRMYDPIPVLVRGSEDCGKRYQFSAVAKNISAGGLFASAPRVMGVGEKITLFVRFELAGSKPARSPAIAARAEVVRVEAQSGDSCAFAACFLRHRLI